MKVHHLNCATMCPRVPSKLIGHSCLVCHCLLIETEDGLVLIDTGLGTLDVQDPRRLSRVFNALANPRLVLEETALSHVERIGFSRKDVRHIVLTHLDVDHAGGIVDFPLAEIHIFQTEYEAALEKRSVLEKLRYHSIQWAHGPRWKHHSLQGDQWFGFQAVRELSNRLPDILMIPLIGHTRGHCGVAVQSDKGWLLHAGDAYFSHAETNLESPGCPPGLSLFQSMTQADGPSRLENQMRLRALKKNHGSEIDIFCAHDASEFDRFNRAEAGR